jgi:hypothetical protein
MSAREKTYEIMRRLDRAGIDATFRQSEILRRAELTLQRCAERECGNGSNWYLERDEKTGLTFNVNTETGRRYRCPDLEGGALRRVASTCDELGIHYYHQTDPRGAALWVSREPLDHMNYTRGVCCGV